MKIQQLIRYQNKNKYGVSADVLMKNGRKYSMYFEVDSKFKDLVTNDASPFLAAMMPIGMLTNEDIEVDGHVSKQFSLNLPKIQKEAQGWNLGLSQISIKVKSSKKDTIISEHTGCFFSGGADSFYTLLKKSSSICSLIFVHGFDIKIKNKNLYQRVEENITKIANSKNVRLIKVQTNIRDIYDECIDWNLAHGFAVGSVALFLKNEFKSIYVSCGLAVRFKNHYGMTPVLDSLFSSKNMKVIHFGCGASKLDKLKELSKHPLAMENLRVCWANKNNAYNCSSCEKCMRNMLGLYLCDALEKCISFTGRIDVDVMRKINVSDKEIKYFKPILQAFEEKGDTSEVRYALEEFINKNSNPGIARKIIIHTREVFRAIDMKYNKNRLYWLLSNKGFI